VVFGNTAIRNSEAASSAQPKEGEPVLLPCMNEQTTLDAPLQAEFEAYAAAGFRHVELWFPKLKKLDLTPAVVAGRLRDAGLTPVCACSCDVRLTRPQEEFDQHLPELKANLEWAQAFGLPRFVITSSSGAIHPDDYKLAAERLARVAELASLYKVRVALEFIASSKLFGCLPTTLSVIRASGHANAGVCLDTFHFFVGSSKTEDLGELMPGEIAHVHFHDAPRRVPRERLTDADRLPPGEGSFPLNPITAALRRIGYRGALSIELFGAEFHQGDPGTVAERCYRAVRKYLS
jgi:sugar phosphate isomerase/epimerase